MTGLLPAMALCFVGADLDGQAALHRAEALLRQLGVHGNIALTSLNHSDWSSKSLGWTVGFSTDFGNADLGLDERTGRVNRLDIAVPQNSQVSNRPASAREMSRFRRVLALLGYRHGLKIGSDVGFTSEGPVFVLVHGLPFFNLNPTYGPVLSLDSASGIPMIFYAAPACPPVNGWVPKVPGPAALSELKAWGHDRAVKKGLPPQVDPSEGDLRAELGYWKLKDEPSARLVWRATKYSRVDRHQYGMGSLRMFIDALTGEFVVPDDPAWGDNP